MRIKLRRGIAAALTAAAGALFGAAVMDIKRIKDIENEKKQSEKHLRMFKMMNQWVLIKQKGKNLEDYFKSNDYKKVIIYGVHYAGETLIEELKCTDIKIVCGIDRNICSQASQIRMIEKEDEIPNADVIVVTAISYYDEIEAELAKRVSCAIISLEDIIYECLMNLENIGR